VLIASSLVVLAAENTATGTQPAEPAKSGAEATVALPPAPAVVTAIPYKSETEYEMDPFDRNLIRRTKTTVTHILLIRSDGSTQVRPAQ
jgi:hypothetical protein